MIDLPERPRPQSWTARPIDFGFIQSPPTGAGELRIDRPGGRWAATIAFPPMEPAKAEIFAGRLVRAQSEGVRIELPLLVPQGAPGLPVLDGAGQAGMEIDIEGLTPGYVVREGFWLTIYDDAGSGTGMGYLHKVSESVAVGADGKATVEIHPPLRCPFGDGASVELAHPTIEGLPEGGPPEWQYPVDRLIRLEFAVREVE